MRHARALTPREQQQQQQAFAALQAGRWQQALPLAQSLVTSAANAPDAHLLHAMCLSEAGDDAGAANAFASAAALAPDNPVILVNQANFLRGIGKIADAIRCAQRATKAAPQWVDAWTALGSSLMSANESPEACIAFDKAWQLQPDDTEIAFAYACALREAERWTEAEALSRHMLAKTPSHAGLRFSLARWLREEGRVADALALVDAAPQDVRAQLALSDLKTGLLLDAGRAHEAVAHAHAVVEAHPFDATAHATLCLVRWEHGEVESDADDALRRALRRRPADVALRLAWVRHLLMTQRPDRALSELHWLQATSPQPVYLALQADACHALDRLDEATAAYEAAHASLGTDSAFLNSFARHCLRIHRPERAAELCQRVVAASPHDQQAWAWLGVAWRLLDDPREHWLCDYDRLVTHVEVPWSDGNADVPMPLRDALEALHEARRAPANQSLRQGSQTAGKLFGPHRDPMIREVESHLKNAVHRHLAALPRDPKHPFLSSNRGHVRMQGSWSVRLHSSGNHVNHVHPDGWCSSAYYVALPESVARADESNAGALQLGQPPVALGLELAPRRIIHPREGWLALFPSYLWHGTVPFDDADPRITIAFDMLPVGTDARAAR